MTDNTADMIVISTELIMYGNVHFKMERTKNGVAAAWLAIADGGEVFDDGYKEYTGKSFLGIHI